MKVVAMPIAYAQRMKHYLRPVFRHIIWNLTPMDKELYIPMVQCFLWRGHLLGTERFQLDHNGYFDRCFISFDGVHVILHVILLLRPTTRQCRHLLFALKAKIPIPPTALGPRCLPGPNDTISTPYGCTPSEEKTVGGTVYYFSASVISSRIGKILWLDAVVKSINFNKMLK